MKTQKVKSIDQKQITNLIYKNQQSEQSFSHGSLRSRSTLPTVFDTKDGSGGALAVIDAIATLLSQFQSANQTSFFLPETVQNSLIATLASTKTSLDHLRAKPCRRDLRDQRSLILVSLPYR